MNRAISAAGLGFIASIALAGRLAKDTTVRIEGTGIEPGWHEGRITVTSEGCTMTRLRRPTKGGYILIALVATNRMQQQRSDRWLDVSVTELRTYEPKRCLEEGAD
jgi:hypothetical protein